MKRGRREEKKRENSKGRRKERKIRTA